MTIREAIISEIEPYSLSDDAIEKGYLDSVAFFGVHRQDDVDAKYLVTMIDVVALAAMYCLSRLMVLQSENVGGISQNFDVKGIEKRIKTLAPKAGVSPELVMPDTSEATITYQRIW